MTEITLKRLKELEKKERKLQALESGGVDNWEWYDEALEEYHKYIEKEEKLDYVIRSIYEIMGEHGEEPAGRGAGYGISIEGQNLIEQLIRDEFYE